MPADLWPEAPTKHSKHQAVPERRPEFFDQIEDHAALIAFGSVHDARVRIQSCMHDRLPYFAIQDAVDVVDCLIERVDGLPSTAARER